jgi:hypothetical protein
VLKKALEDRIAALARSGSWPQIIADLDSLTEADRHDHDRVHSTPSRICHSCFWPGSGCDARSLFPHSSVAPINCRP